MLKFKTILIAIKLDPGLLIPAGQLLQWVLYNWNTHENKEILVRKDCFPEVVVTSIAIRSFELNAISINQTILSYDNLLEFSCEDVSLKTS